VEGVTDPELAIVLKDSATGTWHGWKNGPLATFDAAAPPAPLELTAADLERSSTRPFLILADRITGKPLTADYDMLAFATRTKPAEPEFDPEMGSISAFQAALVQKINNEVRVRANYLGGNVTHHGPENQFPKSPGADFPITAFQPDGYILTIKKGREGRHDYWLKRYLHHLKSRDWFVEPNPYTWNWGPYDPVAWPGIGYRPDDRKKKVADDGSNCFDSDEGDEPRSNLPVPVEGGAR
jgi:hypothetical protein